MDNMAAGWDKPQEDEFALCMLGPAVAVPHDRLPQPARRRIRKRSTWTGCRGANAHRWMGIFLRFLRQLTLKDPRRLVLKSPTHSCRIPVLLELFPDARFVHIVRDPYVVFASTVNLWKALYETHGMQTPNFRGLEEHVFTTFTHLYDRLEAGKRLLRPDRFFEVRYEDLVRDPVGHLRRLYDRLGLGGFEAVRPRIEHYLAEHADYQTNRYRPLDPALEAEITRRWCDVIRRYGYERCNEPQMNTDEHGSNEGARQRMSTASTGLAALTPH